MFNNHHLMFNGGEEANSFHLVSFRTVLSILIIFLYVQYLKMIQLHTTDERVRRNVSLFFFGKN